MTIIIVTEDNYFKKKPHLKLKTEIETEIDKIITVPFPVQNGHDLSIELEHSKAA